MIEALLNDYNVIACAVVFVLMTLDVVTGIVKAKASDTFHSSDMRKGLLHKFAIIVVLFVAWLINNFYAQLGLPASFDSILPLANTAVAIMEISSIAENLGELNPELKKLAIWRTLKGDDEDNNNKKGEKK